MLLLHVHDDKHIESLKITTIQAEKQSGFWNNRVTMCKTPRASGFNQDFSWELRYNINKMLTKCWGLIAADKRVRRDKKLGYPNVGFFVLKICYVGILFY